MRRLPYPLRRLMAVHPSALELFFQEARPPDVAAEGTVEVLLVDGPLEQRGGWWWLGYDDLLEAAQAKLDKSTCDALVLQVSSPGGDFAGMLEASRRLRAMATAAGKPLVGYVDEEACSAAYCLISACNAIVLPPSGVVGSIGVMATIGDRVEQNRQEGLHRVVIGSGKWKGELHPDRPLTDESIGRMQAEIDGLAQLFAELVAEHRPQLTARKVLGLEAETFRGEEAVKAGLADQVGSMQSALELARRRADANRTKKTTAARPQPQRTAMNRDLLLRILGLAADASDQQINEALAALGTSLEQFRALADNATTTAEAAGKLGAKVARLTSLEAAFAENDRKNKQTAAEAEVGALVAQKRLQPSMRAFALAMHGTASWPSFVASLPGAPGGAGAAGTGASGATEGASAGAAGAGLPPDQTVNRGRAFDATELAQIKAMGLTEEQARASLARRQNDPFTTETF